MTKTKHWFRITYFNPNGKMYFSTEVEWTVMAADPMRSAAARLRGLRDSGGQMGMPGEVDEGWPGPILIESLVEKDRPPSQLIRPRVSPVSDYGHFTQMLDAACVEYESEARVQRVATRNGQATAAIMVVIDSGIIHGTFWFDSNEKLLSHSLWEGER